MKRLMIGLVMVGMVALGLPTGASAFFPTGESDSDVIKDVIPFGGEIVSPEDRGDPNVIFGQVMSAQDMGDIRPSEQGVWREDDLIFRETLSAFTLEYKPEPSTDPVRVGDYIVQYVPGLGTIIKPAE